jgi:uncharacterized membrane protein
MNRETFLRGLERGLRALPAPARSEILADYERYFADGVAAGRDESAVAASLGDPAKLAAELGLDHDVRTFRERGAARSALRALGSLTILISTGGFLWLPLGLGVFLLLALTGAGVAALVFGAYTLVMGFVDSPLGGVPAALLRALSLVAGGIGAFALVIVGGQALARLFFRVTRIPRREPRTSSEVSP